MKNKGFTLTEVLITLGIIGVIAALTIPQLVNSTRNAHLGAQYANSISTLENGIGLYLYDKNVRRLSHINSSMTPSTLLSNLANGYIKMTQVSLSNNVKAGISQTSLSGCSGASAANSYILPDQSIIGVCVNGAIPASAANSSELFFLSSASTKQDALVEGFDWFRMAVTTEGHIYIPGKDYDPSAACSELTGGKGCAGKLAMNGWKYDKKIFK